LVVAAAMAATVESAHRTQEHSSGETAG